MPEAPDFLERLRQYEAMLDSRISELDVALKTGTYPDGVEGHSLRLTDKLTIATYRVAISDLHQVFPELK